MHLTTRYTRFSCDKTTPRTVQAKPTARAAPAKITPRAVQAKTTPRAEQAVNSLYIRLTAVSMQTSRQQ